MRDIVRAGAVLGVGLGGFVDGIVFHQLLQWHAMLSALRPPVTLLDKQVNTFWDGLFHLACWTLTCVGLGLLWRARARAADVPGAALVGAMLLGWGGFNVVEGVVDHHLLGLHNVREATAHVLAWNVGFLVASLGLVGAGWSMIAAARPAPPARDPRVAIAG